MDSRSFQVSKASMNSDQCTDVIVLPRVPNMTGPLGMGPDGQGLELGSRGEGGVGVQKWIYIRPTFGDRE